MGYSPWGRKESDTTEPLSTALCLYDHFFYSPLRGKDRVYVSCFFFFLATPHGTQNFPDQGSNLCPCSGLGTNTEAHYMLFIFLFLTACWTIQLTGDSH